MVRACVPDLRKRPVARCHHARFAPPLWSVGHADHLLIGFVLLRILLPTLGVASLLFLTLEHVVGSCLQPDMSTPSTTQE
jgi:hypothetical protein